MPPIRPFIRPLSQLSPHARFSTASALHFQPTATSASILPRFLQPTTYIPSWSRHRDKTTGKVISKDKNAPPKPWNPATFFIWIFLFIGSQSIQLIAIRHESADYIRRTETKIAVLREVVERLQNGEDVDVKAMLGTGRQSEEREWEEVLKELEEEDAAFHKRRREAGEGNGVASEETTSENKDETPKGPEEVKTAPKGQQARSAKDYGFV